MNDQSFNRWISWLAGLAVVVIPALLATSVIWGTSASDEPRGHQHSATVAAAPDATAPTATRDGPSMTERHQTMLNQMRVSVSPQMLDQMNRNDMWHQMVAGELPDMEELQEGLDRMLAR